MKNSDIREVNPTTKRLVERCLAGDWCVQLRRAQPVLDEGRTSPSSESSARSPNYPVFRNTASAQLSRANSKTLKSSRSVENLKARQRPPRPPRSGTDDHVRRTSSGGSVTNAAPSDPVHVASTSKRKGTVSSVKSEGHFADRHHQHPHTESEYSHYHQLTPPAVSTSTRVGLPAHPDEVLQPPGQASIVPTAPPQRRSAPPPPKRRKPPAIPVAQTNGGATFQTIRTSATSPLAKGSTKPPNT